MITSPFCASAGSLGVGGGAIMGGIIAFIVKTVRDKVNLIILHEFIYEFI